MESSEGWNGVELRVRSDQCTAHFKTAGAGSQIGNLVHVHVGRTPNGLMIPGTGSDGDCDTGITIGSNGSFTIFAVNLPRSFWCPASVVHSLLMAAHRLSYLSQVTSESCRRDQKSMSWKAMGRTLRPLCVLCQLRLHQWLNEGWFESSVRPHLGPVSNTVNPLGDRSREEI